MSPAWRIVVALFLLLSVSSGFGFYNMSVYVAELSQALSLSVTDLSLAVTLFFVTGGVAGIYIARIIGVVDIRLIIIVGAVLAGMALAAMSLASRVWQLYVLFVIFGIGNTGLSIVVATTLVTRFFPGKNRSVALSLTSTGLSVGGVTYTPLSAYLFNTLGPLESMPWLGVIFVGVVVPVVLLLINDPVKEARRAETTASKLDGAYRAAIRERFFIILNVAFLFAMVAQVGGIAHIYGRVLTLGDYAWASYAVQALSVGSIVGRFIGGWIASHIGIRQFAMGAVVLQAVGCALIALVGSKEWAVLAAFMFGLSVGNVLMSHPLWLADVYANEIYPRVFALANALMVLGVASGPLIMGIFVDVSGYGAAYFLATSACMVALILFSLSGNSQSISRSKSEA